jgi:hypothetical protein
VRNLLRRPAPWAGTRRQPGRRSGILLTTHYLEDAGGAGHVADRVRVRVHLQRLRAGRVDAGWLQPFAKYQPITPMVDAVRALLTGSSSDVGLALAWSGLLLLICTPVAVFRYRQA